MTIGKSGQHVTKCICHKSFSGYSSVVARSNLRVCGQETTPQSLTANTLDQLEAAGIVGPFTGSKAREVKIKDSVALEQILRQSI